MFFMHLTALLHRQMPSAAFYFYAQAHGISLRIIMKGPNSQGPCEPKAAILEGVLFSDHALITVVDSKYQKIKHCNFYIKTC